MSKAKKVIDSIRDTLSDPSGDRWDNPRLLRSLNEAMLDINLKARILRGRGLLNLTSGISTYTLPDDVQDITRCLYSGKPIAMKTHYEMDLENDKWEEEIGTEVKYMVYDKLNMGQIKTYPVIASSLDGFDSAYGVVTDLVDIELSSVFGVMVDFYEPKGDIALYYIKKPAAVNGLQDDLPLGDSWDKALKHYVCGYTLRDDKDTQNRTFGLEELAFYADELEAAKVLSGENFTTQATYETEYRRI